jgi:hypothetical protein
MKEKLNQEYDTKISEQERIIDALNKQRRMREESDGELGNAKIPNKELLMFLFQFPVYVLCWCVFVT